MPYDLTPKFLDELLTKHRIDYVIHGDDPCILPGEWNFGFSIVG